VKHYLGLGGLLCVSAVLAGAVPEVARAESTQVTGVEVISTESGLQLRMTTANGDRPQIFLVKRGADLVADLINTQLSLPDGEEFRQANPVPGIAAITVSPLDANSTRVVVSGYGVAPEGQAIDDDRSGGVVLSYTPSASGGSVGNAIAAPPGIASAPSASGLPNLAQGRPNQPVRPNPQPGERFTPDVLVPNPDITIDGVPVNGIGPVNPVPQYQPRAVAPPVGDISVSSTDVSSSTINLRTAERVPRLVLREAPVEDVLALLARAAGLNLAYIADQQGGDAAAGDAPRQRTISLDVENESVQAVFNNVLRLSGLEANLMDNTIVVGVRLPDAARNVITRTIRLNQTEVLTARDFLLSYGAEAAVISTRIQSQTVRQGEQGALDATEVTTTTTQTSLESLSLDSLGDAYRGYAALPLRGLLISVAPRGTGIDEVANEISLTGDPRKVEIATQLLSQLETRRRQVAVNVKIVDVSLSNQNIYNSSFSFGVGDTFVASDGGSAVVNFGGGNPPSSATVRNGVVTPPIINNPLSGSQVFFDPNQFFTIPGAGSDTVVVGANGSVTRIPGGDAIGYTPRSGVSDNPTDTGLTDIQRGEDTVITRNADGTSTVTLGQSASTVASLVDLFQYPTRFLATLQAQVVNGNAKILTDPTLVVQEGQTSTVSLTSQVVSRVNVAFTDTTAGTRETRDIQLTDVGLTLPITVSRIDDNGFVTIKTSPTVSAPVETVNLGNDQSATLVQRRSVESGDIRMRDGQTLILSGIIQDTDRTTVTKIPILGDIPLLGALFRSTNRTNQRNEVIVIITPNILNDSDETSFGYSYTPSREARDVLQRQGNFTYPNSTENQ